MRHLRAVAFKFLSTLALLYIVLGITFGLSITSVLLITVTLNVIEYIVGDLIILPKTNNTVATMADFGLALILIWFMVDNVATFRNPFYGALVASFVLAMFEYFFHKYMANNVLSAADNNSHLHGNLQFHTEAAEEFQLNTSKDNKNKKNDNNRLPRI
ncbi:YndM family protein [Peribacillus glennii]|uniref:DUF2512 family protein n=1 Tax=Peribacillus glennii TaxID=2303991 RepID=A0A372L747_9BACI|nr:YndM family protein [Peribacillus glennii]RFU60974.1 DUF2512 family protein [Peribacillus glennii]